MNCGLSLLHNAGPNKALKQPAVTNTCMQDDAPTREEPSISIKTSPGMFTLVVNGVFTVNVRQDSHKLAMHEHYLN